MTVKQPNHRDWLGKNISVGYVLTDYDCCEIRAALADLDKARAALATVAASIRRDRKRWPYLSEMWPLLSRGEADAILAAAEGEQT